MLFFKNEDLVLYVRYNLKSVNLSIISETTAKTLNIDNLAYYKPEMFQLIKPMSNKINGTDVFCRTYNAPLSIQTGLILETGGIYLGYTAGSKTGLGGIKKFGSHLIPEV